MILEHLYDNLSDENKSSTTYKELHETMVKIDTMLHNQTSLDETNIVTLCDLISDTQYIMQKQSFIKGFRYAVQMLKECF